MTRKKMQQNLGSGHRGKKRKLRNYSIMKPKESQDRDSSYSNKSVMERANNKVSVLTSWEKLQEVKNT